MILASILGFKALHNMKVERSIEDIQKNIEKLSNHMNAYKDAHDSLGKTIRRLSTKAYILTITNCP